MEACIDIKIDSFLGAPAESLVSCIASNRSDPAVIWKQFFAPHCSESGRAFFYPEYKKNKITEQIQSLSALPEGWDGEAGLAIDLQAIATAKNVLNYLSGAFPLPDFCPNPNGTISFYWDLMDSYGELEIGRTRFSWVVFGNKKSKTPSVTSCSGDCASLNRGEGFGDLLQALGAHGNVLSTASVSRSIFSENWLYDLSCF